MAIPVHPPSEHETAPPDRSVARSRGKTALRELGEVVRLAVTAVVIVVGLAVGIPWLVGMLW